MAKTKLSRSENKKIIKNILEYIGKYKLILFCSIVLAFLAASLALYIPVLTGHCIDYLYEILKGDGLGIAYLIKEIMIIISIVLIIALIQWLLNVCNNKMTYNIVKDMRQDAFTKLQTLPLSYIDTHQHGDMVSRIISDVDTFADGLLMGLTQFFTSVVTIVGTLFFMLFINPVITILVVVLTPLSLFAAAFIAKKTHSMFVGQSKARGEQTTYIDEMIGNEKVIKAFGREEKAIEDFDEINKKLCDISLKAVFFSSTTNPTTRFINSLIYAVVAFRGSFFVISGTLTVGQWTCLLSYANQYTKPFNEISNVVTELQNAIACAGRIFELINEPSETPDADNAMVLQNIEGNINIEDVAFSYVKDKKLIEDFSLNVSKGQKVAIVGPTGCGKTTFINLLMRFYDVDEGSIKIDGNDIRNVTRNSLRENYGMVLQETWLMHGTIRDNISMHKPDATMEEIVEAAKMAHADSFIRRLKDGYDTYIGEDVGGLSEGQRQLLCIARVMLALPPVLILDEATSSIDTRTEIKIQSAFARMMEGRTSFVVAHRLSTIKNSDIILVMKDGKIIEKGNHDELMAAKGFYCSLYSSQFDLMAINNS